MIHLFPNAGIQFFAFAHELALRDADVQFLLSGKRHVPPELCLRIQFLGFGTPFDALLLPCAGFSSFSRSLVEPGPCKAPHAVCDGDIDFPAPIVYGRIYHLVEHSYPVVCRCISDRFEQMLPAGEQRAIIVGGIGTSRR